MNAMRRPQEKLSQRRLDLELRVAIDRLIDFQPRDDLSARITDLERLLDENPAGCFSSHVLHNLGVRRRAWLHSYLGSRDANLQAHPEARS